ncbi:MAG: hypothetical protein HAW62_05100 [Endozoicomonadaceae bacterium]|nr:hypothetical protein [Endozoicomonadaceae bacterium]
MTQIGNMLTSTPSTHSNPSTSNNTQKTQGKDADDFSKKMNQKEKPKDKKELCDEKEEKTPLSQLYQTATTGDAKTIVKTQNIAKTQIIDKIEQISNQLDIQAVKDTKEVKVQFGKDLLANTEVTIKKTDNNTMTLEFSTSSVDSLELINKGKSALQDVLAKKFDGNIDISVQSNENMSDNQDRSSKGEYFDENENENEKQDKK